MRLFLGLLLLTLNLSCSSSSDSSATSSSSTPVLGYELVKSYPHDTQAFTQGLVVEGEVLIEGTGLRGQSDLRQVSLTTGEVTRQVAIDTSYFGEGITLFGERIFQITLSAGKALVYRKSDYVLTDTFDYEGAGWGITHDGTQLIMSDGSDTLTFRDPTTFKSIKTLKVSDSQGAVERLNELEYINGEIYANIWLTDRIAKISPSTGTVNAYIDLSGIIDKSTLSSSEDVLNGIAYDPDQGRLFVTGKRWPSLFEIKVTGE